MRPSSRPRPSSSAGLRLAMFTAVGQIEAEQAHGVADGARHVEVRARQRPVLVHAHPVPDDDGPALQREGVAAPHAGHGVGDQHELVVRLALERDLQDHRVDVTAVHDDPAPALLVVQRRAHHARLAAGERGHGVEQVGEAAQAVVERRPHRRIAGVGVAGRHHDPGADQGLDQLRARLLGGEGDEGAADLEGGQQRQQVGLQLAELGGVVHPLAPHVEERALDVHAEHPGRPGPQRGARRIDRQAQRPRGRR